MLVDRDAADGQLRRPRSRRRSRGASASSSWRAAPMTSGPMPSPGRTTISHGAAAQGPPDGRVFLGLLDLVDAVGQLGQVLLQARDVLCLLLLVVGDLLQLVLDVGRAASRARRVLTRLVGRGRLALELVRRRSGAGRRRAQLQARPPSFALSALSRASSATPARSRPRIAASDRGGRAELATRSSRGRSARPAPGRARTSRSAGTTSRAPAVPSGRVVGVGRRLAGRRLSEAVAARIAGQPTAMWSSEPGRRRSRPRSGRCRRRAASVSAMSSSPFSSRSPGLGVDLERRPRGRRTRRPGARGRRSPRSACISARTSSSGSAHRQQAGLRAVAVEDVREAGRDDRLEAEVLQRPDGVLARGAAAEVAPGHEDRAPGSSSRPSLRQS